MKSESTIVILGAVYREVDILINKLKNVLIEEFNGFRFYVESCGENKIVIGITGCGCMNGCLAAMTAIQRYQPDKLINIGTCGACREEYHINDIIVVYKAIYMGDFITPKRMSGAGSCSLQWQMRPQEYYADESLLMQIISGNSTEKIRRGVSGTSDVFNREKDRIKWMHEQLGVDCEEMETAAIYKAASLAGTKAAAIRVVSNNELTGEKGSGNPYGISRMAQVRLQMFCQEHILYCKDNAL